MALQRGKTPVNWILQSPTRHGRRSRTMFPGEKPLLQLTFIRPQQRFIVVLGLKRPIMSVQNLFFARPAPKKPSPLLFSITGCVKRSQNVLPAPFFAYFTPAAFYLLMKVKSELASCLMTKGTFKKSLQGVAPTIIIYIKACCCLPRVERCKKTHILLMTMPKNYLKQVYL